MIFIRYVISACVLILIVILCKLLFVPLLVSYLSALCHICTLCHKKDLFCKELQLSLQCKIAYASQSYSNQLLTIHMCSTVVCVPVTLSLHFAANLNYVFVWQIIPSVLFIIKLIHYYFLHFSVLHFFIIVMLCLCWSARNAFLTAKPCTKFIFSCAPACNPLDELTTLPQPSSHLGR